MVVHIHYSHFGDKARKLFLEDKLGDCSIDYQHNSIMGWDGDEEINVYDFTKICRMDNRFSSYELYHTEWGITLEIDKS